MDREGKCELINALFRRLARIPGGDAVYEGIPVNGAHVVHCGALAFAVTIRSKRHDEIVLVLTSHLWSWYRGVVGIMATIAFFGQLLGRAQNSVGGQGLLDRVKRGNVPE